MTCLKCGRETDQTFCEKCREVMEKYPVKPGSIVLLPKTRRNNRKPVVHRNAVDLKVTVGQLRKTNRRLGVVIAALLVLVAAMGYAMYHFMRLSSNPPVGQNYSTVTKPAESSEEYPTNEEIQGMFHVEH